MKKILKHYTVSQLFYFSTSIDKIIISQQTMSKLHHVLASKPIHRSIAGYNPILFSLTIDFSKNFTTSKVLKIGHMPMFVVKSIVI